ncbi:glycosyltransferase [Mycobacterium sp. Y57]|uniref:glycosyltransferase n=1 Tax=Mycolicibacterium xanthum TaxID=2796469 RepID=UPI001C8550A0|nr:nucleotide disphospho-sugar-binding domain-containing protein [Mycolicibacterium xanthum]MBX7431401.1 glycosyltransferase [Mycolicibacterium xanthum]
MATVLIAALSPAGHAGPLLAVAEDLVCRGNRVTVMTGATHTAAIRVLGARPHPLPADADPDASQRAARAGVDALNRAVIRPFLRSMAAQSTELDRALATERYDAVLADHGFFGVLPLLLGDRPDGPPVLLYTTTPLMLSRRVLSGTAQRATDRMLKSLGAGPLPVPLLDAGLLAQRLIVPTVESFEYPRSDLPDTVRFVGLVRPRPARRFTAPSWWPLLSAERPVVHVTQGTVDNRDLTRLVGPTIAALADEDVTVVVSTGGRDVNAIGLPLPANTHAAEYIPHDRLLPRVDVVVTNGGYGAVQHALSAGVPCVVAGGTGDRPEVAARVAWSGAGIDLGTATPTAAAVQDAVRRVRTEAGFLQNARRLEAAFARRDGVAEIAALLDEVIAERAIATAGPPSRRKSSSGLRGCAGGPGERLRS